MQTACEPSAPGFRLARLFKLVKSHGHRERTPPLEALELRTSEQLVAIIDVLLGLTLVEGAFAYKSMFTHGSTANWPAMLAMVLVYLTALWSFVDWHIAMQVVPYRIQTKGTRGSERARVALDFLLMASYSFLILRAHVLIGDAGADLLAVAITYPAIYAGYILWGLLRNRAIAAQELDLDAYSWLLLALMGVLTGVLLWGYAHWRHGSRLGMSAEDFNVLFLALELLILVSYRSINSLQQLTMKANLEDRHKIRKSQFLDAIRQKTQPEQLSAARRNKLEVLSDAAAAVDADTLGDVIGTADR